MDSVLVFFIIFRWSCFLIHGFKSMDLILQVRTIKVEKRINEVVNRLNKTKVERKPDLKGTTHFFAIIHYAHILFNMIA